MRIYTENGKTVIDGENEHFECNVSFSAENTIFRNFHITSDIPCSFKGPSSSIVENNIIIYTGTKENIFAN